MGAPYIYDISRLRVKFARLCLFLIQASGYCNNTCPEMRNFQITVLRKLLKVEENYTGGISIICKIPFIVRARVIKSNKLREARCILCGKNERFVKVIVGKSKGKN